MATALAFLPSVLAAEWTDTTNATDTTLESVRWQPYTGTALNGGPLAGELGRLRVPENRQRPNGATLELAFVRYRTSHPQPGPPIFFLVGGPGGSGVEHCAVVATHPQIRLLEHSDVIGIDQRGTGLSVPNLMATEIEVQLAFDRIDRTDLIAAMRDVVTRTVTEWNRQGVDLSAYNSVESADDIDAVRRALGLEKIVLYGSSYGSHLGLAYLRRHDEHVARAILSKVEGPDHTWKLPSTVQRHVEQFHHLVVDDPAVADGLSDVQGTVRRLLRQLAETPVIVQGTEPAGDETAGDETAGDETAGDEPAVMLGPLDLQIELSQALSSSNTIAEIPAMLAAFANGDWSALAAAARENRRVSIPAMTLMMDCASGATATRLRQIEQEMQNPAHLLGDAIMAPFYPETCAEAGPRDLGDSFRGPLDSEVPILFTSGTLDVRTPPGNVDEILDRLPNAVHVVAENAGHESRELMSPEYRDLFQAFLRGESIESCRITLPEPMFDASSKDTEPTSKK